MRGRDELTSVRDDAAGSELRVLVSHLALVDLLETLGDIPWEEQRERHREEPRKRREQGWKGQ
jgi:hypothetical protein